MNKYINCGTLNVRGIITDEERQTLTQDALQYNLHIVSIPETHLTEDTMEDITIKDENGEKQSYILYATTKTGILTRKDLQPKKDTENKRTNMLSCHHSERSQTSLHICLCTHLR